MGEQVVVEKMLAAEGVSRLQLGREAFEERVWQWKREYGDFIASQMRRMGASCDWTRERFTLDAQLSGEGTPPQRFRWLCVLGLSLNFGTDRMPSRVIKLAWSVVCLSAALLGRPSSLVHA